MAYSRKKAEQIVTALEDPLNVHLLKLLGLDAPAATRAVWRREIKSWLRRIAAIALKPDNKRLSSADLYAWLYDEPFGGAEARNVEAVLALEGEGFSRAAASSTELAARLQALHLALAARLAVGDGAADLIDAL